MSAHWAHTTPYGAFVSIRKGSPFLMLTEVAHGLASGDRAGYQPLLASCSWENTT